MKITITFNCDNEAFVDDYEGEIAFIMERATQLAQEKESWPLKDSNGNTVGSVEVKP